MSMYRFIASDYPLPPVDNRKMECYKFNQPVKFDIGSDGKWYYYTNENDINSPKLLTPCSPKEADRLVVEKEEDLHELYIDSGIGCKDTGWYTSKKYIYTLEFWFTEKRANEFIEYLKNNMKNNNEVEIWSIWLDHLCEPDKYYCNIESLTAHKIKEVFDSFNYDNPNCLILSSKIREVV